MGKPTIWIDMTDLHAWQGNPTGIQRTVHGLAKYFAAKNEAKFFYFDPTAQAYKECDFIKEHNTQVRVSSSTPKISKRLAAKLPLPVKNGLKKVLNYEKQPQTKNKDIESPFNTGDTIMVLGGNWGDDYKGFIEGLQAIKKSKELRIVHVVYDLIPIKFPNYFVPGSTLSYERYLSRLVNFADELPCISQSTKNDLDHYIQQIGIANKPRTSVIRIGEELGEVAEPNIRESLRERLKDPFIVCVGTLEARKNHSLLYYVTKEAKRTEVNIPQIVIAGRRGWMTGDIQNMIDNDPDTKHKLFIIDDASDVEIAWLYKNCQMAIYPSMYEGWGLPLAEAAHYGKLCLSSNLSSMPEVMGDLIDYFSPFDAGECLKKIVQYTADPQQLKSKETLLAQRQTWTWQQAYSEFKEQIGI